MSDGKKQDLTRIEDMGEFLHQEDPETDRALMTAPLTPEDLPGLPDEEPVSETLEAEPEETPLAGLDELESDAATATEEPLAAEVDDSLNLSEPEQTPEPAMEADALEPSGFEDENSLVAELDAAATSESSETVAEETGMDTFGDVTPEAVASEEVSLAVGDVSVEASPFEITEPDHSALESATAEPATDIANDLSASSSMDFPAEESILQTTSPAEELPPLDQSIADVPIVSLSASADSKIMVQVMTPLQKPAEPPKPAPREDFQEVKKFGNAVTTGAIKAGGNPPFSVMINRIRYRQDADELLAILEEVGLAEGSLRKDIEQGLQTGALLLGQLSEYSAIYLAHRIRHLDIDVRVGLGELIHQSKYYDSDYRGLVERENLAQNKELKAKLTERPITPQDILVTSTTTVDGYEIKYYLNMVRESVIMSETELEERALQAKKQKLAGKDRPAYNIEGNNNVLWAQYIDDIYEDLTGTLRLKAHQMGGNAIVGLSFGLTPMLLDHRSYYRIIAFGNVVKLSPLRAMGQSRGRETNT